MEGILHHRRHEKNFGEVLQPSEENEHLPFLRRVIFVEQIPCVHGIIAPHQDFLGGNDPQFPRKNIVLAIRCPELSVYASINAAGTHCKVAGDNNIFLSLQENVTFIGQAQEAGLRLLDKLVQIL